MHLKKFKKKVCLKCISTPYLPGQKTVKKNMCTKYHEYTHKIQQYLVVAKIHTNFKILS